MEYGHIEPAGSGTGHGHGGTDCKCKTQVQRKYCADKNVNSRSEYEGTAIFLAQSIDGLAYIENPFVVIPEFVQGLHGE